MTKNLDTIRRLTEIVVKSINDTTITTTTRISCDLSPENSSQIILEYLKVLIWPTIILILIAFFYNQLKKLFDRIINDSKEINSSVLGLSAKFRRQISNISSNNDGSENLKKNITETIKQNLLDEFKLLSSYFFTKSFQARKQTAVEISRLSQNLQLEDLLNFASSPLAGERVGAFIGIKTHISLFSQLAQNEKIADVIRIGLDDGYSRVRYRVIQPISTSDYLISIFRLELETLLLEENNNPIKKEIEKILSNYKINNNC